MERTKTPGIFKRGARYVVVFRHRGRQHKRSFRTLAEAREFKGRRDGGERTPTTRAMFEDYASEWLRTYRGRTSRGLARSTVEDYERSIRDHAIPHFDRARLADIESPDIRAYVTRLEGQGLRPSSVRKRLAPLRALFATAAEDGKLRHNPTLGVRVSGSADVDEDETPRALTRDELRRLLAELPPEHRLFFELLAHTGLRISEAAGLRWRDVDFGARPRLRVREQFVRGERRRLKSKSARRDIPLSPAMSRRLWTLAARSGEDAPMFCSAAGTPLHPSNLRNRVLAPAARRAGLEWAGFHTLRHTCASMLFDAGRNVKQVQRWLGHATPSFTLDTYIHLLDEGLGDAGFFDAAVGNAEATEGPQSTASEQATDAADSAS